MPARGGASGSFAASCKHATAALLVIFLFPGCSLLTRRADARRLEAIQKAEAEASRRPVTVGRIALVNREQKFVLIDGSSSHPPAAETTLRVYSGTELSGELRVTGVQRRPFLIADITSGDPKRGDTVLRPGSAEPAPPRALAAASPPPAPSSMPRPLWKRLLFLGQ